MPAVKPSVFEAPALADYALMDSGEGEKLERFGPVVLRRPDPQALWRRRRGEDLWSAADLTFVRESDRGGRWEARRGAPKEARGEQPQWQVSHGGAQLVSCDKTCYNRTQQKNQKGYHGTKEAMHRVFYLTVECGQI